MAGMAVSYPNAVIASKLLGQDVTRWINDRRDAGRTWRSITSELYAATDGVIDVVHETVRTWATIGQAA